MIMSGELSLSLAILDSWVSTAKETTPANAAMVLAPALFTAVRIGYKPKLRIPALHALKAAQRIFGIPDFHYYALTDGIKAILSKSGQGILTQKCQVEGPETQLALFLALIFGETPGRR